MKTSRKPFIHLFFVLLCTAVLSSCGPDFLLRSRPGITATLQGKKWQRVLYVDSSKAVSTQYFEFAFDSLTITSVFKNGSPSITTNYNYFLKSNLAHATLNIFESTGKYDPFMIGKWQIITLKKNNGKHILQLARDGAKDDFNPKTNEGGLAMLDLIEISD